MKKKIEEEALRNFATLEHELLTNQNISYDFRMEVGFMNDRVEHFTQKVPINFLVMDREMTENRESFDELVEHITVPLVIVP